RFELLLVMPRPPPSFTLFPYTTLFRSPRSLNTRSSVWPGWISTIRQLSSRTFRLESGDVGVLAAGKEVTVANAGGSFSDAGGRRSEEHTSELQSRFDLVCRLLLEKKNK